MSNALLNRTTATVPHRSGRTFLNRRTAVATLVAATLIGGGVAIAYPPGMGLAVSASATPNSGDPTQADVMVTLDHADPGCSTTVTIGSTSVVFGPGQTTGTLTVPNTAGRQRVEARTVKPCAQKEHAHSRFVISNAQASGPAHSPLKANAAIDYSGLDPDDAVTATATLSGSSPVVQHVKGPKGVNNRGEATVKIKLDVVGTWVVTTSTAQGVTVNSVTITVP